MFKITLKSFLGQFKDSIRILDIGCGNDSPLKIKQLVPDCYYVGVDIGYYNQSKESLIIADKLFIFEKASFFNEIEMLPYSFDVCVATHIIEHLPDPEDLFKAVSKVLAPNGKLFLTTPNFNSVNFPSSKGTLNFYDDVTHVSMPVPFHKIFEFCSLYNLRITRYKPGNNSVLYKIIGLPFEIVRRILGRNIVTTWAFWGFEDVYIIEHNKIVK